MAKKACEIAIQTVPALRTRALQKVEQMLAKQSTNCRIGYKSGGHVVIMKVDNHQVQAKVNACWKSNVTKKEDQDVSTRFNARLMVMPYQ